ncbi:MAG: DUF4330 domain-containing protein [Peptococcaceae bacterium]|jgi:hypothetical protein|nr:MAG: DUF4330 domain-containing protein [Peptococcaceae bacterium]
MKLIDDRGRLFGLINIIDLFVVLIVLGVVWGLLTRTAVLERLNRSYAEKPVEILFLVENVRQYTVDAIQPGEVVRELRSDETVGTIRTVEVRDYKEKVPDLEGNWHMSPVPGKKELFITVEGRLKEYNGAFRVGQSDIKVGSKVTLKGKRFNVETFVLKIQD